MKLSEHFDSDEFRCKCCGMFIHNQQLINDLEHLRLIYGRPIHITRHGGNRCQIQNEKSGGAKHSKHLTGEAADIWIEDVSPRDVYLECCKLWPDSHGIGHYHTFTHLDVRQEKARWSA